MTVYFIRDLVEIVALLVAHVSIPRKAYARQLYTGCCTGVADEVLLLHLSGASLA